MTTSTTPFARIVQLRAASAVLRAPFHCFDCGALTAHTDPEHVGNINCVDCHCLREYAQGIEERGVEELVHGDYYDIFCHLECARAAGGDPLRFDPFADLARLITVYQAARGYRFEY